MQEVNVTYQSNGICDGGGTTADDFAPELTFDQMCAVGFNATGICYGDSGGPLIIPGSTFEEDVQVGLVSWGYRGCGHRKYQYMAQRDSYLEDCDD